jgi:hypothetical protein
MTVADNYYDLPDEGLIDHRIVHADSKSTSDVAGRILFALSVRAELLPPPCDAGANAPASELLR